MRGAKPSSQNGKCRDIAKTPSSCRYNKTTDFSKPVPAPKPSLKPGTEDSGSHENIYCDVDNEYEHMDRSGSTSVYRDPDYQNSVQETAYVTTTPVTRQTSAQETYQRLASFTVKHARPKLFVGYVAATVTLVVALVVCVIVLGLKYRQCTSTAREPIDPGMPEHHMTRSCRLTEHGRVECYHFLNAPVTLSQAHTACAPLDAGLANVTSQDELDFLTGLIRQHDDVTVGSPQYGATCSDSTSWDSSYTCNNAISGDHNAGLNDWVIAKTAQPAGSWLNVTFSGIKDIHTAYITNRCLFKDQVSSFSLTFDDGSTFSSNMKCQGGGTSRSICPNVSKQQFKFMSRTTSSIRLTIDNLCRRRHSKPQYIGLRGIEVIGSENIGGFWIDQTYVNQSLWSPEEDDQDIRTDPDPSGDPDPDSESFTDRPCFALYPSGLKPVWCGPGQRRPVICRETVPMR